MARQFCITCNSYQDSWYDRCNERCGNDCRERCQKCNRIFSTGALTVYNPEIHVPALSDSQVRQIQDNLDRMIERSGGRNEYEYKIEVQTPQGYNISQSIIGRRR